MASSSSASGQPSEYVDKYGEKWVRLPNGGFVMERNLSFQQRRQLAMARQKEWEQWQRERDQDAKTWWCDVPEYKVAWNARELEKAQQQVPRVEKAQQPVVQASTEATSWQGWHDTEKRAEPERVPSLAPAQSSPSTGAVSVGVIPVVQASTEAASWQGWHDTEKRAGPERVPSLAPAQSSPSTGAVSVGVIPVDLEPENVPDSSLNRRATTERTFLVAS